MASGESEKHDDPSGSIGLSERARPENSTLDAHFPESAELDTPMFCLTYI